MFTASEHKTRHMDVGMFDKNVEFTDERDFERRHGLKGLFKKFFHKTTGTERRGWLRRVTDKKQSE